MFNLKILKYGKHGKSKTTKKKKDPNKTFLRVSIYKTWSVS